MIKTLGDKVKERPRRYDFVKDYATRYFEPGYKALEVGSSDGTFAYMFKDIGYEVTAFDIVDRGIEGLNNYVVQERGFELYKSRSRFELIHVGQVLEHVEYPKRIILRARELGVGMVVFSVPNFWSSGHLRVYNGDRLYRALVRHFWIERIKTIKLSDKDKQFVAICHSKPNRR